MSRKSAKKLSKYKSFDLSTLSLNGGSSNNTGKLINRSVFSKENDPKFMLDINKKVTPKNISDLAIHSKKIQEVEGWIKCSIDMKSKIQTSQFLLITGPAGCGKSITIETICKSNNINLTEWFNPVDIDYEVFKGPGQVTKFNDFLMESKYGSLFGNANSSKILMIKEFPNTFFRNPQEFFNVLDKCYYKTKNPIIFICSESSVSETNVERILFPEEIQLKYAISKISFNPCAATLLKKALKRAQDILQYQDNHFNCVPPSTIDEIVKSSLGDIRTAMNQLYMIGLAGFDNIHNLSRNEKQGTKRKRTNRSMSIKNVERDESLGLFHGLGRVLNPKRIENDSSWRINCDIGKLIDEFGGMPSTFIDFLIENYLKYFGDLDDVQKASEILSLAREFMTNSWDNSDSLIIGLWISILGLMVFNEHKVNKWTQINVLPKIESNKTKEGIHPTDMFYYNIIKKSQPTSNQRSQVNFVE